MHPPPHFFLLSSFFSVTLPLSFELIMEHKNLFLKQVSFQDSNTTRYTLGQTRHKRQAGEEAAVKHILNICASLSTQLPTVHRVCLIPQPLPVIFCTNRNHILALTI